MRVPATQPSPLPWANPATAPLAAASRSASSKTIVGDLPPSSRVTRLRSLLETSRMRLPTASDPVKEILSTSGWLVRASPVMAPSPVTMLTTPCGRSVSSSSSPIRSADSGDQRGGLGDHGVAGRQRRAQLPRQLQNGTVPRGDGADDTQRLAQGVVERRRVRGSGLTVDLRRPARVVPEDLHRVVHQPARHPQRAAHVERVQHGQLSGVRLKDVGDLQQDTAALVGGDVPAQDGASKAAPPRLPPGPRPPPRPRRPRRGPSPWRGRRSRTSYRSARRSTRRRSAASWPGRAGSAGARDARAAIQP